MKNELEEELDPAHMRLYLSAKKLAGLAYLIECEANADLLPKGQHDAKWGLALILQDIQIEVADIAGEIEELRPKY